MTARRTVVRIALALCLTALGCVGVSAARAATGADPAAAGFALSRSSGVVAAACLKRAHGTIRIVKHGATETMTVSVTDMVPNAEFDVFVIQVPNAPFGISWYQGDLHTDSTGAGHRDYIGRFSIETFAVAPGSAPAPQTHPGVDATTNPAFAPVHTYHVGVWFGSPSTAAAAGCPTTVTPFNGDHNAGIQALSTRTFPDAAGPLSQIT